MDFIIKAAQLLLALSLLVVLHEFGHYLTARYFKIKVEKFYLFFNPWFSIFKKKIGDTEWGIGWLPLGGYVKIAGMIDESMDKEQMEKPAEPWEFRSKPAWQRLIVMIGGVVVNLIVGVLIYIFVVFAWGEEQIHTSDLKQGLSIHPYMEKYDLRSGDNILEIEDEKILHINDINSGLIVRNQHKLKVQRPNGDIETVTLPEGIDYELFTEGAFPTVGLRHKSTEVNVFLAVKDVDSVGVKQSDVFISLNGKTSKEFSYQDLLNNSEDQLNVSLLRGGDTVVLNADSENLALLFSAYPMIQFGFQKDDQIVKINEREIEFFDQITSELYTSKGKKVDVIVKRNNEEIAINIDVTENGTLGFAPVPSGFVDSLAFQHIDYSFGSSVGRGFAKGWTTLTDYAGQLKFLFTKKGASSIGGFGALGNLFPASWDWQIFWLNTALISIILAFMNILPIPALDGGHVVFLLYEMITGKEAPEKVLEIAQYIGFFLILGLVLYANGNDIYRAIFGG